MCCSFCFNIFELFYNMNIILKVFACAFLIYFNCCECILESNLDTVGVGQRFNECGISKGNSISPLIVGGTGANVGTFPWHAGLYYREDSEQFWQQKCGGSLITDQFILTAAHCVSGVNETNIRVSLGKIFRSWDLHEVNEQRRNVSKVSYPNQFERTTFYFDIALLLLNERIKPGGIVMPVCTGILGNHNFLKDKELLISGWGRTENTMGGSASETLLYNDVMFVPNPICRKYLSPGYSLFDKFCTMKNNSDVSIAQRGDSGGGLTVVHDGRHYIYGVVSVKLTDIKMTLFSNLTWTTHLWWIENELRKLDSSFSWSGNIAPDNLTSGKSHQRIAEKGCELPGFPAHGVYKSVSCSKSDTSLACRNMPGVVVPSSWELGYICDRGYSPSMSFNSVCDNGVWRNPNDCIKYCPPLKSISLDIKCYHQGEEVLCSSPMKPGTIAKPRCKEFYSLVEEPKSNKVNVKYLVYKCLEQGEWNRPLFNCTPECGKMSPLSFESMDDGKELEVKRKTPWLAIMFVLQGYDYKPWRAECVGTLITPHILLSETNCLVIENKTINPEYMKVGLGKYYWDYYKSEDSSIISEVREIIVPRIDGAFHMGLVDLMKSVELTTNIWPACVDWSNTYVHGSDTVGIVSRWKRREQDAYEVLQIKYLEMRQFLINTFGDKIDERLIPHQHDFCGTSTTNETVVLPNGTGYTTSHNGSYHVIGVISADFCSCSVFREVKHSLTWLAAEIKRLEDIHKA